jgi:hypothetical protein
MMHGLVLHTQPVHQYPPRAEAWPVCQFLELKFEDVPMAGRPHGPG